MQNFKAKRATMRAAGWAGLWVASLALWCGGAAAQRPPVTDENCKWPKASVQKVKSAKGRIVILQTKFPGAKVCTGGQCDMQVEVQSYTNRASAPACCVRAEYATFQVDKGVRSAGLRWNLVPVDKNSYVFNAGDGVKILQPQPNPLDFEQPTIDANGQWYEMPSRNGRVKTFNYGFTVFRKDANGTYLACDPYDPIIVNQGD